MHTNVQVCGPVTKALFVHLDVPVKQRIRVYALFLEPFKDNFGTKCYGPVSHTRR